MNIVQENSLGNRYTTRNSLSPTNFYFRAPEAKLVQLQASFTKWCPIPMRRHIDGWWRLQVPLPHGHHQYRFLIEGEPVLDPTATGTGRDEQGEAVSLVAVS